MIRKHFQSKKIVIVDDEPIIRMLFIKSLESLQDEFGTEIYSASNGREGLDYILRLKPDLVVLDVMMPEMDGFEVCRQIRQQYGIDTIYIMMVTAKAEYDDRIHGMSCGANQYIIKPLSPANLLQISRQILQFNN